MARIVVSRETKITLLEAAKSGADVDAVMLRFVSSDLDFQRELFRTAERAKNWRFLERFSKFRADLRGATGKRAGQRFQKQVPRLPRIRQSKWPTSPQFTEQHFTHCPRCNVRLLSKVLTDHLDLACPKRGQGPVPDLLPSKQKEGQSVDFCICGKVAIPGDSCCDEHKHT
jgi:hypothetical protein